MRNRTGLWAVCARPWLCHRQRRTRCAHDESDHLIISRRRFRRWSPHHLYRHQDRRLLCRRRPKPTATRTLGKVIVTSNLDTARDQIAPSLGASTYSIGPEQIQTIPQGENAPFQQVLLRMPSVVTDSFGQVHVRGEHANTTYRSQRRHPAGADQRIRPGTRYPPDRFGHVDRRQPARPIRLPHGRHH